MKEKIWDLYKNKKVRLYVIDGNKIRPRDGIFIDYDETHVFLTILSDSIPTPFLRSSIKRLEIKEDD